VFQNENLLQKGDLFMNLLIVLLCLVTVVALAIYWNVWKIRNELSQNLGKMLSELPQIRQSLQKTPSGNWTTSQLAAG